MHLPRIPLPDAIGSESHFFEIKVYNTVLGRLEARLHVLHVPVNMRWRNDVNGVADFEQIMYALLKSPSASPLDKFEGILRFAFAYEQAASGESTTTMRAIGHDVLRGPSLTL